MDKQQKMMVAGGALAGLASTLLLTPAEALFPSSGPIAASADQAPTPVVASTTSATAKPAPSASQSATKSKSTSSTTAAAISGSASIAGGRFGTLNLKITVKNGKLAAIDYSSTKVTDRHSYQIDVNALPRLVSAALSSQSANVSNISGASYTTSAFRSALQSAMSKAGL